MDSGPVPIPGFQAIISALAAAAASFAGMPPDVIDLLVKAGDNGATLAKSIAALEDYAGLHHRLSGHIGQQTGEVTAAFRGKLTAGVIAQHAIHIEHLNVSAATAHQNSASLQTVLSVYEATSKSTIPAEVVWAVEGEIAAAAAVVGFFGCSAPALAQGIAEYCAHWAQNSALGASFGATAATAYGQMMIHVTVPKGGDGTYGAISLTTDAVTDTINFSISASGDVVIQATETSTQAASQAVQGTATNTSGQTMMSSMMGTATGTMSGAMSGATTGMSAATGLAGGATGALGSATGAMSGLFSALGSGMGNLGSSAQSAVQGLGNHPISNITTSSENENHTRTFGSAGGGGGGGSYGSRNVNVVKLTAPTTGVLSTAEMPQAETKELGTNNSNTPTNAAKGKKPKTGATHQSDLDDEDLPEWYTDNTIEPGQEPEQQELEEEPTIVGSRPKFNQLKR